VKWLDQTWCDTDVWIGHRRKTRRPRAERARVRHGRRAHHGRRQNRARVGIMGRAEIACAECGCIVDRGVVLVRCGQVECCCRDLPDAPRT
jgi:hypothetical protein